MILIAFASYVLVGSNSKRIFSALRHVGLGDPSRNRNPTAVNVTDDGEWSMTVQFYLNAVIFRDILFYKDHERSINIKIMGVITGPTREDGA